MAHLREGIGLRSYAQTNPLQDYVNEGYDLFREMNDRIAVDTVYNFINVRIQRREPEQPKPAQEGAVEVKAEEKPAEQPSGENKE